MVVMSVEGASRENMPRDLLVDANVLLRLITADPPDMARRALRLAGEADAGTVRLVVLPTVVAEVVWVLGSYYGFSRRQIADTLTDLASAGGMVVEDQDHVLTSLDVMAAENVDFVDAYLAVGARARGLAVCSFDRDFRRLGVEWAEP